MIRLHFQYQCSIETLRESASRLYSKVLINFPSRFYLSYCCKCLIPCYKNFWIKVGGVRHLDCSIININRNKVELSFTLKFTLYTNFSAKFNILLFLQLEKKVLNLLTTRSIWINEHSFKCVYQCDVAIAIWARTRTMYRSNYFRVTMRDF